MIMELYVTQAPSSNSGFYGCRKSDDVCFYGLIFQSGSGVYVRISEKGYSLKADYSKKIKLEIKNGEQKINNNIVLTETYGALPINSIYLCSFNSLGYPSARTCIRIYTFSISRNNQLQLNFIPCLDDTGTPCMYDTVSHTPFYNKGTGDFLYKLSAPETKQLPYGYYPLSYLESTGEQWIDTGIRMSNENEVTCKFEPLNFVLNQYVYGACTQHLVDDFSCLLSAGGSTLQTRYGLQNNTFSFPETSVIVIKHSNEVFVNDAYKYKFNETPFESANTCRVFDRSALCLIGRVYSFSISRNGQLQLDFQPCLDDKGVPCMYDFVSGKSFYNKGTGANFLYEIPAEIAMLPATMALREEKVEYGILTENGLRRLYHPAKKLYFLPAQLTAYALENGYKPIIENEKPTDGNWTPVWTETEDEIILTWEEINEDEYTENW